MAMYIKDGKNLFTVTNTLPSGITYDKTTGELTIKAGAYAWSSPLYTFATPIPANTKVSVRLFVKNGKIGGTNPVSIGFYHFNPNKWQGHASIPQNTDLTGKVYTTTWVTTDTATHIWLFLNNTTIVEEDIVLKVACCYGDPMETFEPYNYARRVKVLEKYGIRNEFDISKLVNVNGISHTGRDFSKTNNYASGSSAKTVQQVFPFIVAGETYTFACTVESSAGSEDASGMITCLQTNKQLIPPKLGYVKRVVTINADDLQCLFYPYGLSNGTITWKDFMCVKGDYSNKEMPEWRPFTPILNPKIFMTGGIRNEFDISKIGEGEYLSATYRDVIATNVYQGETARKFRELFPYVEVGEAYTFACTIESTGAFSGASGRVSCIYNGSTVLPTLIPQATTGYVKNVITITEEMYNGYVSFYGIPGGTVTWKDFMCVRSDYSNKEMPKWRPFSKL